MRGSDVGKSLVNRRTNTGLFMILIQVLMMVLINLYRLIFQIDFWILFFKRFLEESFAEGCLLSALDHPGSTTQGNPPTVPPPETSMKKLCPSLNHYIRANEK
jgi:hypothetical protein